MLTDARAEATVPTKDLKAAREFYEGTLGLRPVGSYTPGADVVYECGGGTRLVLTESLVTLERARTAAHFLVADVAAEVRELRERGVEFEEYDLPELRTVDGVAHIGDRHFAWFRVPDNMLLGIHD
jgi:catechol 2,3-dioxygenase-like lactoylglutathione lyase family enzyme